MRTPCRKCRRRPGTSSRGCSAVPIVPPLSHRRRPGVREAVTTGARSTLCVSSLLDAIEVIDPTDVQGAARGGWRGPEQFLAQGIFAQHLELRPGLKDVRLSVLVQAEDLAVGGPRRGPE